MTVPGMHEQPPRQTATITVVLVATVAWALLTSLVAARASAATTWR
jgi:hypothetical protein